MKHLLALFLLCLPLYAETQSTDLSKWRTWNLSAVTLAATASFDIATSIGHIEINPMFPSAMLGQHRKFDTRSGAIYGAVIVGNLAIQRVVVKRLQREGHHMAAKRWKKMFTVVNFSAGGLHTGAGIRNLR